MIILVFATLDTGFVPCKVCKGHASSLSGLLVYGSKEYPSVDRRKVIASMSTVYFTFV